MAIPLVTSPMPVLYLPGVGPALAAVAPAQSYCLFTASAVFCESWCFIFSAGMVKHTWLNMMLFSPLFCVRPHTPCVFNNIPMANGIRIRVRLCTSLLMQDVILMNGKTRTMSSCTLISC